MLVTPLTKLDRARYPETPGFYWAKKSPAADWLVMEVVKTNGRIRARPRDWSPSLFHASYALREFYEWGLSLADAPEKPEIGHMEAGSPILWAERKKQRAHLRNRVTPG